MKRFLAALVSLALAAAPVMAQPQGDISLTRLPFRARFIATEPEAYCIAGLTQAADTLAYFTGASTCALTTLSSAGRSLIDDASVAAMRTTLGLADIAASGSATDLITGTVPVARLSEFTSIARGAAPASGGGTANFLRADATWAAPVAVLGDADYGDLTVSSSGTVWNLDAGVVGDAELRDSAALSVVGRSANSTGDPADIAAGTDGFALRRSGTTLAFGTLAAGAFADDTIVAARLSATASDVFFGRDSASAGTGEEIGASAARTILSVNNVDNTSDANKPVSTATQTALDLKANLASPTLTGAPAAPTASAGTSTTQIATTAFATGGITDLIAGAPSGLNTLDEIAAAIGDDASYSSTISSALSGKQPGDAQLTSVAGLAFAGNSLKVLRVNAGETDFELATPTGGGDALTSGTLAQFAATTSAQLAGVLSDETGGDSFVRATSPTMTTPQISAIELSHATANTLAASGGHATIESATLWDSGNDGAASTLDADLLDGSSSAAFAASGANTNLTSVYLDNTGLKLKDTNATHGLSLVPGSNITADRALTITTGDADRTLDISAGSVTVSTAGAALIDDADASAQRTTLGLGTIATQAANSVSITGGSVTGITDLAVADGGSGASTAAGAATAFGVGTGDSPQFTAVNVGHATDTTFARSAAGRVTVEGDELLQIADITSSGYPGQETSNSASSVSLTNDTIANCTSISLTAGTWDIQGWINFIPAAATTITRVYASLTTTTAATSTTAGFFSDAPGFGLSSGGVGMTQTIAPIRVAPGSTMTYYLTAYQVFAVSTMTANCTMRAVRIK